MRISITSFGKLPKQDDPKVVRDTNPRIVPHDVTLSVAICDRERLHSLIKAPLMNLTSLGVVYLGYHLRVLACIKQNL